MDEKKMDEMDREQRDPQTEEEMQAKRNMKDAEEAEPKMDGPNLCDPGETSNVSQDEGKIYDL